MLYLTIHFHIKCGSTQTTDVMRWIWKVRYFHCKLQSRCLLLCVSSFFLFCVSITYFGYYFCPPPHIKSIICKLVNDIMSQLLVTWRPVATFILRIWRRCCSLYFGSAGLLEARVVFEFFMSVDNSKQTSKVRGWKSTSGFFNWEFLCSTNFLSVAMCFAEYKARSGSSLCTSASSHWLVASTETYIFKP